MPRTSEQGETAPHDGTMARWHDRDWSDLGRRVRQCLAGLVPAPDLEDVAQQSMLEVVIAVHRAASTGVRIASLEAVAVTIARRRGRDHARSRQRRASLLRALMLERTSRAPDGAQADRDPVRPPAIEPAAGLARGRRQRVVLETIRRGGTVQDCAAALALPCKEINRIIASMIRRVRTAARGATDLPERSSREFDTRGD